jgi:acetyl esterase/lipase
MRSWIPIALVLAAPALCAQEEYRLWDGDPPYSKPNRVVEERVESWGVQCVVGVTEPTLTVHAPQGDVAPQAVIVLPGGGYEKESIEAEGHEIAAYFASRGITAAVLKYRLPLPETSDQPHLVPQADARRAVALMRSLASHYGFEAGSIGVAGFSAGGHLAATVSILPGDRVGERPDFSVLIYGALPLSPVNRTWLEETLFHRPMTAEELSQYALVERIDGETPPAFLVHAYDDDVVPVYESEVYAEALRAAGQDAEIHLFPGGGHGFGPGRREDGTDQWLGLAADWIRRQ